MKGNPRLKAAILEVVDNQIGDNDPPETKQTLHRLMSEGYCESEAREMIGGVVAAEIFDVVKKSENFNLERFVNALSKLPEQPWE
jgi:hypothetical protein